MPKSSPIKTSFNAGEWSPLMAGHINLEKFPDSCLFLQNMIALKQGPITRRGGTMFVKEVKDSSKNTVLIPFEFSVDQAYQIEAGDTYFRFYRANSAITETGQDITDITQANPAVVTYDDSLGEYANGEEVYIASVAGMTEVNGKFYRVANVNTTLNTFELTDIDGNNINSTGYTAYTSGGTVARVYEIISPYSHSDLVTSLGCRNFQFTQSADVLYIAHGDYNVRSVARQSDTSWSVNSMVFNDGPYLPLNDTTTTLTLSGTTGSVTVTASSVTGINNNTGFKSTDVGRLIRFEDPAGNWTWLEITAFTDTTHVTATIKGQDPSLGSATTDWRLGVYSETTGYPRVIAFFQDRLFLGGSSSYPDRWDLSRTGGYSDTTFYFAPSDRDGTVTDDAAINGTLQSGKVNVIQWAGGNNNGLIIGTAGKEWLVSTSDSNEVLTPSNAKADPFSAIGSSYVQSIQIESGSVFVQRARRKVMDIVYSFEVDQLKPRDLTIASEHITRTGICEMQFQQEPINVIWMRRTDGLLLGFTYYPDENVFAAHRHSIGGTDTEVKSISVIPSADGSREELSLIVSRTIDGVTRQYIEYMTRYYEDDIDKEDAIVMDSSLVYDGNATTTVSGLEHLEGETVKVMIDGKSHPDLTVSGGAITLANSRTASVINIGLSNEWRFKSQRMEAGAADGTAQGKTKRITRFVIRLMNSLGLKYGSSFDDDTKYNEYDFNQGASYDEDLSLFSGDTESLEWPEGYETDGIVYLHDDGVFPITVLSIMPQLQTFDR